MHVSAQEVPLKVGLNSLFNRCSISKASILPFTARKRKGIISLG